MTTAYEQIRKLEATVRAQASLIAAMEQTKTHLLSQQAKWNEAIKTLESEREANRILTQELEQAKQALAATPEPAPMARLTLDEQVEIYCNHEFEKLGKFGFAEKIMDAMIAKNEGQHVSD